MRHHLGRLMVVTSVIVLMAQPLSAATTLVEQQMREANQAYEQGEYAQAIDSYRHVLASGFEHSTVHYNLGNAYYKHGELGRAIASYRRAQRLSPRDADVVSNVTFAEGQIRDRIEPPARGVVMQWVLSLHESLSIDEHTVVELVMFSMLFVLLLVGLLRRRESGVMLRWSVVVGLCWGVVAASLVTKVHDQYQVAHGVVLAERVDVRSGPSEDYAVQFTVHEGTELTVVNRRIGWKEVRIVGGLRGWMPEKSIELL